MTNADLKSYKFESFLLDNIELFNEALEECGEALFLENKNFLPFLDFPISPWTLTVELKTSNANQLPITIWFEGEDLRIDIDQMNESFDWSRKQIKETREKVVEIIRNLLTGYVLIETRGVSRFIQIFDVNNFFSESFSYNNWFHTLTGTHLFRYKNYRRLYLPAFTKR